MGYNFPIMFKVLAVFSIVLYVLPVQAYAQTHKAKQATKSAQPATPVPLVVPQQAPTPASQSEHKEHVQADVRVISTPSKDRWDIAGFCISVALAIVGVFGVRVAIKTLGHIETQANEMKLQRGILEKQATHMDAQTRILETSVAIAKMNADTAQANIKQWLDVELTEVEASVLDPNEPDPLIDGRVLFQAFNNTALPLTVTRVVTVMNTGYDSSTATAEETVILPPKASDNKTNFPFWIQLLYTDDAARRYLAGKAIINITGTVFFTEASGKDSEQEFGFAFHHTTGGYTLLKRIGKHPAYEKQG